LHTNSAPFRHENYFSERDSDIANPRSIIAFMSSLDTPDGTVKEENMTYAT